MTHDLQAKADAIQLVAQIIQPARELRGEDEMIHPNMPEDDHALVRCLRAMIDCGDGLANDLRWLRNDLNELCRKWMEGEGDLDELLTELFEDGLPGRRSIYEWQKSRERMQWVAEHRHVAAYRANREPVGGGQS